MGVLCTQIKTIDIARNYTRAFGERGGFARQRDGILIVQRPTFPDYVELNEPNALLGFSLGPPSR